MKIYIFGRSLQFKKDVICWNPDCPCICDLLSGDESFVEFLWKSMQELFTKSVNKLEFCDNRLIFVHTLIKGINRFLHALSICLEQSEWNSVLKISTLCRWAFGSFVKIAVNKMHFTYGRKWNITHIFCIFPIGCLFNERILNVIILS
jgi:hypothetical protein